MLDGFVMFKIFLKKKKIVILTALLFTVIVFAFYITNINNLKTRTTHGKKDDFSNHRTFKSTFGNVRVGNRNLTKKLFNNNTLLHIIQQSKVKSIVSEDKFALNYNVHAFYYCWYGNPINDEQYYHWNHRFLPHWEKRISNLFATGQRHKPPDDIGANYYPLLGAYSSLDPKVISIHMQYFQRAGIGVLALSWYPPGKADEEGKPTNQYVTILLDAAQEHNIKLCFHIEPYQWRNANTVGDDIKYIIDSYGSHPAFYTTINPANSNKNDLPLIYIYDSYLTPTSEWKALLSLDGSNTIRKTNYDAIVIGLLVENQHKFDLLNGGFDGFYTYFASNGFSYGSNTLHWKVLASFASENKLLFIPSVGPGYIDTNVRPWNGGNTKMRNKGRYYENSWEAAINHAKSKMVSITSFNEWHEGTQIEPAESAKTVEVEYLMGKRKRGPFTYLSYDQDPFLYLDLTRTWIKKL